MVPGGITEIIWHFAGYIHLTEEIATTELVIFDGRATHAAPDDPAGSPKQLPYQPDADDGFDTIKVRAPELDTIADGPLHDIGPIKPAEMDDGDLPALHKLGAAPATPPAMIGGGGGGSFGHVHGQSDISVVYQHGGGDQLLMQAGQLNHMADDDQLLVNDSAVPDLLHIDIAAKLAHLIDQAVEQTPDNLNLPQHTDAAPEFLASHDADVLVQHGAKDPHSVQDAHYDNGEFAPIPIGGAAPLPADVFTPTDVSVPEEFHNVRGDWAVTGGNTAVNAGLIVDVSAASPTMIVLGNYFKTDAIIQTNSYVDNDRVELAGGDQIPQIATHGDSAHNVADFDHRPSVYPDLHGNFAGPAWHVDVVNGDYFDLKLLNQTNYISDNDVVAQDTQQSHFEIHTGENGAYNLASVSNGSFNYDLIIIGGDYHGGNFIFQNNILLDTDVLKALGVDHVGAQSVSTGDNTLLNHAAIQTYGDDNFLSVSDGMSSLISALAHGETGLAPSFGDIVPGRGLDTFNVLYVSGDYYDINAIWQNNVISDADTVLQYLSGKTALTGSIPGITSPDEPDTIQSISTGGNKLINDATIVTVGATDTHVGGGVYTDSVLIQANLVTSDKDKVVHADPHQLASELVAFVTPNAAEPQHDDTAIAPAKAATLSDDMLAGMMH